MYTQRCLANCGRTGINFLCARFYNYLEVFCVLLGARCWPHAFTVGAAVLAPREQTTILWNSSEIQPTTRFGAQFGCSTNLHLHLRNSVPKKSTVLITRQILCTIKARNVWRVNGSVDDASLCRSLWIAQTGNHERRKESQWQWSSDEQRAVG